MEFSCIAEAQLFRLLSGLFGHDHVIPYMSVFAVCGDEMPAKYARNPDTVARAKAHKCLFTVTDPQGNPKVVVTLFSGFDQIVETQVAEFHAFAPGMLRDSGVRFINISDDDMAAITDPDSDFNLVKLLELRLLDDERARRELCSE